jgi:predicted nucleic acid-binding protein
MKHYDTDTDRCIQERVGPNMKLWLAALLFGEADAAALAARLEGARLATPALLGCEIANVCLTKMRRHPHQREKLLAAFGLAGRLAVETVAADHAGALALAEKARLTAYDASYLWLARQIGAELVTLDRRLTKAAAASRP